MLSSYKGTLGFKSFDCTEQNCKVSQFIELLQDSEVRSVLKFLMEEVLATSDLQILKRLAAIEAKLGLSEIENDVPTIPERLDKLEEKVNTQTYEVKPFVEPEIKPTTQTEERAVELVAELKTTDKGYLSTREIIHFLKRKAPNIKNIWKVKKDVLEKAQELYPGTISLNRRDRGRHEVRIILAS
jgi:hypothetical protein